MVTIRYHASHEQFAPSDLLSLVRAVERAGFITVNAPPEALERLIADFRRGGGEGKPLDLQVHACH